MDTVSGAGGCITQRDLAGLRPAWVAPLEAAYRGCSVHVPPPPSEAFQYLLTLRILDGFDIARHERNGAGYLDLVWRAIRVAAGVRVRCSVASDAIAAVFEDDSVAALRATVLAPMWRPLATR